jgi:hypothetical protein
MEKLGHIARMGNESFITKCSGKTEAGVKVNVQFTTSHEGPEGE